VSDAKITIEEVAFGSAPAQAIIMAAADELDRRYGPETDSKPLDPEDFEPPNGSFLIARIDSHLAGGVGLRRVAQDVGEIKRLWVRPDLRCHGVGALLMAAVEEAARDLGQTLVILETGPLQPEAVALYASTGWEVVDRHPIPLSDYPDAIRFLKRFSG